jgi:hypothetical protein
MMKQMEALLSQNRRAFHKSRSWEAGSPMIYKRAHIDVINVWFDALGKLPVGYITFKIRREGTQYQKCANWRLFVRILYKNSGNSMLSLWGCVILTIGLRKFQRGLLYQGTIWVYRCQFYDKAWWEKKSLRVTGTSTNDSFLPLSGSLLMAHLWTVSAAINLTKG